MRMRLCVAETRVPPVGRHGRFVSAVAVDAIGSGVFMPISVLYFLASASLSLVQIGLALSKASGLRLPFSPLLGGLVDRIGAKQILLVATSCRPSASLGTSSPTRSARCSLPQRSCS